MKCSKDYEAYLGRIDSEKLIEMKGTVCSGGAVGHRAQLGTHRLGKAPKTRSKGEYPYKLVERALYFNASSFRREERDTAERLSLEALNQIRKNNVQRGANSRPVKEIEQLEERAAQKGYVVDTPGQFPNSITFKLTQLKELGIDLSVGDGNPGELYLGALFRGKGQVLRRIASRLHGCDQADYSVKVPTDLGFDGQDNLSFSLGEMDGTPPVSIGEVERITQKYVDRAPFGRVNTSKLGLTLAVVTNDAGELVVVEHRPGQVETEYDIEERRDLVVPRRPDGRLIISSSVASPERIRRVTIDELTEIDGVDVRAGNASVSVVENKKLHEKGIGYRNDHRARTSF